MTGPDLDGRRAVVTGASRGIGAATARLLAAAGAEVVLVARGEDRLRAVADSIGEAGGWAHVLVGDVGTEVGAEAVVVGVAGVVGDVDVLVNNAFPSAALVPAADPLAIEASAWREAFEASVVAPHRLVAGLVPGMRRRSGGSIVNVVTSSVPVPGFAPAGAAKAGLAALTAYLAIELAPIVRVNAVCPGTVGGEDDRSFDRTELLDRVPLGRRGRPEEVAAAILHLASDAASYTTGVVLGVTGGRPI